MKHGLLNPTLKSATAFKHCPLVQHNDSLKLHQRDWLIPWWIQCPQLCGADCYNLQQNPHGASLLLWHLHGYLWDNSCGFDEIHKSLCFHSFYGRSVVKTDVLTIAWLRKYTTSRGTLTACVTLTARIAFHFSLLISVKTLHFVWEGNINIRTSSHGGVLHPLLAWKRSTMNMCDNLLSGHFVKYLFSCSLRNTNI